MGIKLLISSIAVFLTIILSLLLLISYLKKKLRGNDSLLIKIKNNDNEEKVINTNYGTKLYESLANKGIYPPTACGGGGTCGQCKVKVINGGGDPLLSEKAGLTKKDIKNKYRLSCQMPIKDSIDIELPQEIMNIKEYQCKVVSNNNVSSFIKELVLKVEDDFDFKSGQYIQVTAPPYDIDFKDIYINEEFHDNWTKDSYDKIKVKNRENISKAYSMANYPLEKGLIKLNVRIALPPSGLKYPPGIVSSYIFNLKENDEINITGPYGDFLSQNSNKEKIFLGGGAGMAPLRSIIFDELNIKDNKNKISFWYGARSKKEMFYEKDFNSLTQKFDNFSFHIALSEPLLEDNWQGHTGFIHSIFEEHYLSKHEDPQECEYYMCGPRPMINAVLELLDNYGVEEESIFYDDFG